MIIFYTQLQYFPVTNNEFWLPALYPPLRPNNASMHDTLRSAEPEWVVLIIETIKPFFFDKGIARHNRPAENILLRWQIYIIDSAHNSTAFPCSPLTQNQSLTVRKRLAWFHHSNWTTSRCYRRAIKTFTKIPHFRSKNVYIIQTKIQHTPCTIFSSLISSCLSSSERKDALAALNVWKQSNKSKLLTKLLLHSFKFRRLSPQIHWSLETISCASQALLFNAQA